MRGADGRLSRLESRAFAGDVAALAVRVGVDASVLLADAGRVAVVLTTARAGGLSDGQVVAMLAAVFGLPVDAVRDVLAAVGRGASVPGSGV